MPPSLIGLYDKFKNLIALLNFNASESFAIPTISILFDLRFKTCKI